MRVWTAAAVTVAAVVGLGFVHPFGTPRVEPAEGLGTLLQGANMLADAKAVLVTKCTDCHSSETRRPVYARVAPGSWLIERDIVEARKHMDLSRWQQMPVEQQQVSAAKIVQETKSGDIPPLHYLALTGTRSFPRPTCRRFRSWAKVRVEARQRWMVTAMLCAARLYLKSAARVAIDGGRSQGTEAGGSVWSEGRQCYGIYLFRELENSDVMWNDATPRRSG